MLWPLAIGFAATRARCPAGLLALPPSRTSGRPAMNLLERQCSRPRCWLAFVSSGHPASMPAGDARSPYNPMGFACAPGDPPRRRARNALLVARPATEALGGGGRTAQAAEALPAPYSSTAGARDLDSPQQPRHLPASSPPGPTACSTGAAARGILAACWPTDRPVESLEINPMLCAHGRQLARRAGVAHGFIEVDALATTDWPRAGQHAVALHACGDLHRQLIRRGVEAGFRAGYSLAAHRGAGETYATFSDSLALTLSRDDARLAVTGTPLPPRARPRQQQSRDGLEARFRRLATRGWHDGLSQLQAGAGSPDADLYRVHGTDVYAREASKPMPGGGGCPLGTDWLAAA